MKFVTIVVILSLHLPLAAQQKVNIFGHLTQVTNIGSLSLDGNLPFTESPFSAGGNGPVYMTTVTHTPPFSLSRNNTGIGGIGTTAIYPISRSNTNLRFYGQVTNLSYFSIRCIYEMIAPNKITSTMDASIQTCANTTITLRSSDNWPLFADDLVTPSIIWEYSTNGATNWQAFDSSSASYTLRFPPIAKLPVSSITNFRFRCRTKARYADKTYYSPYSTPSDIYTILPSPPAISDTTAIIIRPSCAGTNNGRIHIPGKAIASSFPLMRWILRPGTVTGPCDSNCGDIIDWSNGADSVSKGVNISNIPAGTYTLWLLNPGGSAGNCLSPIKVTIPAAPALDLGLGVKVNITCHGANDGIISVYGKGGDGYHYSFALKTPTGAIKYEPAIGTFVDLAPGDYQVMVMDTTCGDTKSMSITLTEPPPFSATATAISPICGADGSITVTTTGKNIALYKDTVPIPTFTGLTAGHYTVKVSDRCGAWDTSITLTALAPLTLQLLQNDTISCHGDNTGQLRVAATGGIGRYQYILNGNITQTNTTGDFHNLPAGSYTIQVKNDTTCDDAITQQYTIIQRPPIQLQILATPITCNDADNGTLQAIVTGGTGTYNYTWKKQDQLISANQYIDQLPPGKYRVNITSDCPMISDSVILYNPLPLTIESVIVNEAICREYGVTFDIIASGGDAHYTFSTSIDHGEIYTDYTPIHTPGEYSIMVTDGKGCIAWAPDTYTITLPDTLQFTTTQQNITCRGNDDGHISICATGGVGDYTYSLNNSPDQPSPAFDNLFTGNYYITVTDDKGCKKSTTIYLSEDSSKQPLIITTAAIKGVYCANDSTGEITLTTTGGNTPYSYTMDNNQWQTSPMFSGLQAGKYAIQVKDSAGCRAIHAITITSQYPPIYLTPTITPVQCYGASNGALYISATGGDEHFTYQWQEPGMTPQRVEAGTYHLTVTDGKGCRQSATYEVPQPPLLTMHIETYPTCDGLEDGQIIIHPQGGTAAYTYAINSSWQTDTIFKNLSASQYPITIQDANGCTSTSNVSINKKNTQPDVNFLVVSQDHISDTIAVREICLPAPDDVQWTFSPSAHYLGNDLFGAPLIRFYEQGDYWVQLSATFGTCTYTLKKEISILPYDPESRPVYQLPAQVIEAVSLSPNPNNGYFNYTISLHTKQAAQVFVYDLNGRLLARKQYEPTLLINDHLELNNVLSGIYLLRVLTENDSKDVPFIISRL